MPLKGKHCVEAPSETRYFLYRGVHANHPALVEAKRGTVIPGNIHGSVTPRDHNHGSVAALSQYTSWTTDRSKAEFHARKFGPGGVLLAFPIGSAQPGDSWSWEWSPDVYGESEVLLHGTRTGATVIAI
jgi:hypothetical protein